MTSSSPPSPAGFHALRQGSSPTRRSSMETRPTPLDWFRTQASAEGGGNYQTMINQVLRAYIESYRVEPPEDVVRRVVREELQKYRP